MKIITASGTNIGHDFSLCFVSNNKLNYLKFERFFQIKHYGRGGHLRNNAPYFFEAVEQFNRDYLKILNTLKFDIADVETSHNLIQSRKHNFSFHHKVHAMSVDFMENTPCDVHIVIDGNGDKRWYSVFRDDILLDHGLINETNGSLGSGLPSCAGPMKVDGIGLDTAGKIMGLQSYGKFDPEHYEKIVKYNMKYLGDGPVETKYSYFSRTHPHLFKIPNDESYERKLNMLHTIHRRAGEIVLSIFEKHVQPHEKVGYSGGVAQNVVWNTELKKRYPNLVIYPHSNDEGQSIGKMEMFRQKHNIPKSVLRLNGYPYCQLDQAPDTQPSIDTIHKVAKFLAEGKIVAWYQGHGEIGPRALGNRSILMDPRISNGKDIINRVKKREWYRPFGCSVLSEYAKEYFDLDYPNPYMLYLGCAQKNDLPAITHVDGTSRAQTVDINSGHFRTLIEHFFELTGCPVLLNTSLNEAGKPIAGWIKNAENLFATTPIDVLVIGNEIRLK